jgi:hypothetical protein
MKRISEIIIKKKVSRPKRDSYGNRYQENLVFNVPYNPTIKDIQIRVFAKAIDFVLYIILTILIYAAINRVAFDDYEIYSTSLISLLLINPLLESKYGKSIGKVIFKIQVIDDYGEYPNVVKSYKRNFFSLINVFNLLRPVAGKVGFIKNNKHNEICKTYTIRDKDKFETIKLMKK